jgi:hypothetical protein
VQLDEQAKYFAHSDPLSELLALRKAAGRQRYKAFVNGYDAHRRRHEGTALGEWRGLPFVGFTTSDSSERRPVELIHLSLI